MVQESSRYFCPIFRAVEICNKISKFLGVTAAAHIFTQKNIKVTLKNKYHYLSERAHQRY
jgi:hypothetical protein